MAEPFIGSEAVATGEIVKSALRTKYTKLFRDVYVNRGTEVTAQVLARAGWLWSGRQGIIAGMSASALYGAKWIDTARPLEMIHSNRNRLAGLRIRSDRIEQDEFQLVDGIPVTTCPHGARFGLLVFHFRRAGGDRCPGSSDRGEHK